MWFSVLVVVVAAALNEVNKVMMIHRVNNSSGEKVKLKINLEATNSSRRGIFGVYVRVVNCKAKNIFGVFS